MMLFRTQVIDRIRRAESSESGVILTSVLSRLECRVKPVREGDQRLLKSYERFFSHPQLQLLDISRAVVDLATRLRAEHGFKTPDAIQLASAIDAAGDLFLSGDAALARCTEIKVEILQQDRP
jgi:predicted nucleic acid-binding protein